MNFSGSDQMLAPDLIQAILASHAANYGLWQQNQLGIGQFPQQNLLNSQFIPAPTPFYPQLLTPHLPLGIPPETPQFLGKFPEKPDFLEAPIKKEPCEPAPSTSEPVEPEKSIDFVMGQLPTETYYPTHFMRGTQLNVANGVVKKVEDLSSDDFLRCAAESTDVMVNASVVKSIKSTSPGSVQIIFQTGGENQKIPLQCQIEHPFFVLGKGWCSCNPRKSGENYGLDCAELEINDVCVVLTRKEDAEETRGAVDIVTAERDLDRYGQLAARREQLAEVYYEYTSSGRLSAPPERICTVLPVRHRRSSE